jgi:hypothetical protein
LLDFEDQNWCNTWMPSWITKATWRRDENQRLKWWFWRKSLLLKPSADFEGKPTSRCDLKSKFHVGMLDIGCIYLWANLDLRCIPSHPNVIPCANAFRKKMFVSLQCGNRVWNAVLLSCHRCLIGRASWIKRSIVVLAITCSNMAAHNTM